jgi:hypothetical protein
VAILTQTRTSNACSSDVEGLRDERQAETQERLSVIHGIRLHDDDTVASKHVSVDRVESPEFDIADRGNGELQSTLGAGRTRPEVVEHAPVRTPKSPAWPLHQEEDTVIPK